MWVNQVENLLLKLATYRLLCKEKVSYNIKDFNTDNSRVSNSN